MTIELVPLCTATLTLAEPIVIPDTPVGVRVIGAITGFDVEGERLRGHLHGAAAADWLSVSPAMIGTIDVRALIETDDGALIYTWYHGRLDLSEESGGSTAYSAPLYETGAERYAWLNKIQAVAKGTISDDRRQLTYEIAEVR